MADKDGIVESPKRGAGAASGVTVAEAFRVWVQIALLSFGGPAGQIAVMHRILVEERRWISERRFLHALNYCMLLPGPEAMQLATYIGWLLHGTLGGLMAGGLFILPGVVAIMALSLIYAGLGQLTIITGLFFGLKAAVLTIVIQAVLRLGKRALKHPLLKVLAAAAFAAIFFFDLPFPVVIAVAALAGLLGAAHPAFSSRVATEDDGDETSVIGDAPEQETKVPARRTAKIALLWLSIWLLPLAALWAVAPGGVFFDIALFFSKIAVVTFGGAYAILAYVAQQAVGHYHWLGAGQMMDGLGMAETTPGPLIMVLQFVGFIAAFHAPGQLPPLLAGALGGLLASWVTFVPCFLWIFAGAPYIERLRGNRALSAALTAITATVVGVILNLAIWFAIHSIFRETVAVRGFGLHFDRPVLSSLDPLALALTLAAAIAVFRFNVGMMKVLAAAAIAGMAITFALHGLG
jgi:chromate transporter